MAIMSITDQAVLFLYTVLVGGLMGFIFDCFRVLRKTFRHPAFLIQAEDAVYWLAVSFIMFYFMLNKNYGEIRVFAIVGVAIGSLLYYATISNLVLNVLVTALKIIIRIITTAINIMLFPIKLALRLLSFPARVVAGFVKKIYERFKKVLQKSRTYAKIKVRKALTDAKIVIRKA